MIQRVAHWIEIELAQIAFGRPNHAHILISRRPNFWICGAEQQDTVCTGRRSEVRNSAVMSEKDRIFEKSCDMRQWQALGKANTSIFSNRFE